MAVENQHLKHGKALCGKVFARFVETFNALVDFMCNVQGDADAKNGEGHITVDRSNPAHPVIRCDGCCQSKASGNDNEDDPSEEDPSEGEGGAESGVTSLNEQDGDIKIIGGECIKVEFVAPKVIRISYAKDKPPDPIPEEPVDPCAHPEGDPVPADDTGDLAGHMGGGVPADGDSHAGEPCPDCSPTK